MMPAAVVYLRRTDLRITAVPYVSVEAKREGTVSHHVYRPILTLECIAVQISDYGGERAEHSTGGADKRLHRYGTGASTQLPCAGTGDQTSTVISIRHAFRGRQEPHCGTVNAAVAANGVIDAQSVKRFGVNRQIFTGR